MGLCGSAHRHPSLVHGGEVTQQFAGEGVGYQAGGEGRDNTRQDGRRTAEQQTLGRGEVFGGSSVRGHLTRYPEPRLDARGACPRCLRAGERLDDTARVPSPGGH